MKEYESKTHKSSHFPAGISILTGKSKDVKSKALKKAQGRKGHFPISDKTNERFKKYEKEHPEEF